MKNITTLASLLLFIHFSKAQTTPTPRRSETPSPAISGIAIPFFDARHAALGEAGVATSPDYADIFFNPAKTAFAETRYGFYSSYNTNSQRLDRTIYLFRAGVNYKLLNDQSAISINFNHFNDVVLQGVGSSSNLNFCDWALGVNYAKKLNPKLSLGIGLKYIKSIILSGFITTPIFGYELKPAETVAADISLFHQSMDSTKLINLNYGIYISNLSGRVSYGGPESNFIPTNLKIGIAPTIKISKSSTFTLAIDANKLMIPTPIYDTNGKLIPTETAIGGILGSFGDAPDGLREELQEITWSIGGEFWYKKMLALRIGKFIESNNKGGRNFTTFGVGTKIIEKVNVDLAYLHSPYKISSTGNFWRVNLTFGIGKIN